MERRWKPEKNGEYWNVVMPEAPMFAKVIRLGKDGTPLRFWNEKSAQLHADSLNPALIPFAHYD